MVTPQDIEQLYADFHGFGAAGRVPVRCYQATARFANLSEFEIEHLGENVNNLEDLAYQSYNKEIITAVEVFIAIDAGSFYEPESGGFCDGIGPVPHTQSQERQRPHESFPEHGTVQDRTIESDADPSGRSPLDDWK
jgi:hypothetical protein